MFKVENMHTILNICLKNFKILFFSMAILVYIYAVFWIIFPEPAAGADFWEHFDVAEKIRSVLNNFMDFLVYMSFIP